MSPAVREQELKLRVLAVCEVARGVRVLDLADVDGAPLPPWTPGAHIDLLLRTDLVRQYSLCGDPAAPTWRVAVLHEHDGRGGSAHVHERLAEGDVVPSRGPRNHFGWQPAGSQIFVAGGIGITPLLPMMAAADAAGVPFQLHYGGRTRPSMAFAEELADRYGDRVHLHPQDEQGLLDLDAILGAPRAGVGIYCCGPGPLLDAVESNCAAWPAGALRVERFSPRDREAGGADDAFEVELATSGLVLPVPTDRSILAVLEDAGVPILSSCTEGTCGTCETGVLAGQVQHRDSLLTAQEQAANDVMFVCVSRAAAGCSRLVLDL